MDVFCACPFPVALLAWEPAPGRRSLAVCVKATIVLVPGGPSTFAVLQEPVRHEAGGSAAPDLVPYKPRADVLFTGHAHAPGGAPTDSLIARARVATFRKSLSINGDRAWVPSFEGLRPSVPVPFRRMPLDYERAVRTGENLTGVDISQGAEPNCPLANIAAIADQGGETPGLTPIPLAWRAHRLGMGDAGLVWASRAGLVPGPPPAGFDFRLFNAAPAEQQLEDIPPGAEIVLENLHPEHQLLSTRLPALRVKIFRRSPRSPASVEVPTRCDTLWIDTDRGLAFALWRGAVPVEGGDETVGRLVVTAETEAERVTAADVDAMLARVTPDATYVDPSFLRGSPGAHLSIPDPIPVPDLPPLSRSILPPPSTVPPAGHVSSHPPHGSHASHAPAAQGRIVRDDGYPPVAAPVAPVAAAEAIDESPTPVPGPITLVPPPAEPSAVHALPFRSPSASEDDEATPPRGYPSLTDLHSALAEPPRRALPSVGRFGTIRPEPAPLSAAPVPPPPPVPVAASVLHAINADDYAALRLSTWRGDAPLAEALARSGVDAGSFLAHEAAQREAIEREAEGGGSQLAIALLDELAAAARGA